jgi:hypothetical protein
LDRIFWDCGMIRNACFLPGFTVLRHCGDSVPGILIRSSSPHDHLITTNLSNLCARADSTSRHSAGCLCTRPQHVAEYRCPVRLTSSTGPLALPCHGHPALSHQGRASGPASFSCARRPVLPPVPCQGNIRPGPARLSRSGP